jgi:hypothetical protein
MIRTIGAWLVLILFIVSVVYLLVPYFLVDNTNCIPLDSENEMWIRQLTGMCTKIGG